MSKVIVFSDLQAHTHQKYSKRTGAGTNSRLEVALDVLDSIWEYATDHCIEDIFFAGDLFETKNKIPITVIVAVLEELDRWVKSGIQVLLIPGNHDHSVKSGNIHALRLISSLPRFNVVTDAQTSHYALTTGEILMVTAVPYREKMPDFRAINPGKKALALGKRAITEALGKKVEAKRHVLLGHGNMEGFSPLPFKKPEDAWESLGDWIRATWLKGMDHAFIGHIHQPGKKTINGCPVVLPGCPYQENASAKGEARGFYIWDTEANTSVFVEAVKHPRFFDCKVPIVGDFVAPPYTAQNIALLQPENNTVPLESIRKARKALYAHGAAFVETVPAQTLQAGPEGTVRASVDPSQGPLDVLRTVVQEEMVNTRGVGKRTIYQVAQQIITECQMETHKSPGSIQLLEVMGQNVLCYEDISLPLDGEGLIGIGGENLDTSYAPSNGTGKSSMVDLISLCLYGKTLRDIRADKVIRRTERGYRSMIRFRDSTGREYEIFRTRKDKQFDGALHFHYATAGHTLDSYEPPDKENDLRGEGNKETQQKIAKMIGMSFEMFRSLVVLGQGGGSRFSSLKDSEKKHLLCEVMGVSLYEDLSAEARAKKTIVHKNLEINKFGLTRTINSMKQREERLAESEEKMALWEQGNTEEIQEIQKAIQAANHQVDLLKQEAKDSHVSGDKMEETTINIRAYQDELQRNTKSLQQLAQTHEERKGVVRKESATYRAIHLAHDREAKRLKRVMDAGECAECGEPSSASTEEKQATAIENAKAAIAQYEAAEQELYEVKEACDLESNILTEERQDHEQSIQKLQSTQQSMQTSIQLAAAKKQQWLTAVENCDRLYRELEKKEQEKSPWGQIVLEALDDVGEIKEEVKEAKKKTGEQEELENALTVVADAFGPKGARSLLFDSIVPAINERLHHYCKVICGNYINVQVAMTSETTKKKAKEEIELLVDTLDGESPFNGCSGGEQRRLDIPIILALQDIAATQGIGMGVCFLDEAFENMDIAGKEGLLTLLPEIAQRSCTTSVFVVTHDDEVFSRFGKTITFRKQNGISQLG